MMKLQIEVRFNLNEPNVFCGVIDSFSFNRLFYTDKDLRENIEGSNPKANEVSISCAVTIPNVGTKAISDTWRCGTWANPQPLSHEDIFKIIDSYRSYCTQKLMSKILDKLKGM